MTRASEPGTLVMHAVRLLGFGDTVAVGRRSGLDAATAREHLLDAEASGWVRHAEFADLGGWSLTEAGRARNEELLATELRETGCAREVRAVHEDFLPLNARLLRACTDWQLRPGPGDRLVPNDHADPAWDGAVLDELGALARGLASLVARLAAHLPRFGGYDTRFAAALARARSGAPEWIDGTTVDSCHRVWFELHEDLIATLSLRREHPTS